MPDLDQKRQLTISQYLLWLVIAFPVVAIADALALRLIWRWFLAAQYGDGPALGAWFGVSTIVGVMTYHLARNTAKRDEQLSLGYLVSKTIERLALIGMTLALSYGVGTLFRWVG